MVSYRDFRKSGNLRLKLSNTNLKNNVELEDTKDGGTILSQQSKTEYC